MCGQADDSSCSPHSRQDLRGDDQLDSRERKSAEAVGPLLEGQSTAGRAERILRLETPRTDPQSRWCAMSPAKVGLYPEPISMLPCELHLRLGNNLQESFRSRATHVLLQVTNETIQSRNRGQGIAEIGLFKVVMPFVLDSIVGTPPLRI